MTPEGSGPLAPWLVPEGFSAPRAIVMLREASAVTEAGRFALGSTLLNLALAAVLASSDR